MDEAERCHEIAYIAYGELLARGTIEQVIEGAGLTSYTVTGPDLAMLGDRLAAAPGVDMVAPFGQSLHVAGRNPAAVERAIDGLRGMQGVVCSPSQPSLEDVFISLMSQTQDNYK